MDGQGSAEGQESPVPLAAAPAQPQPVLGALGGGFASAARLMNGREPQGKKKKKEKEKLV